GVFDTPERSFCPAGGFRNASAPARIVPEKVGTTICSTSLRLVQGGVRTERHGLVPRRRGRGGRSVVVGSARDTGGCGDRRCGDRWSPQHVRTFDTTERGRGFPR